MKEINVQQIEDIVRDLCIKANLYLPKSLEDCIRCSAENELSPTGKEVLSNLARNIDAAKNEQIAICQDTGMAVIFLEIGQDVHFTGGSLYEAINKGVARGYKDGYLRCSIVADPIERANTGDNTPAVIHTVIVDGDKVSILLPKGFGRGNMSRLKMFTPSATVERLKTLLLKPLQLQEAIPALLW
jgi:fumarate hydratase subunit alpha